MATITEKIKLQDEMSSGLKKIGTGLQDVEGKAKAVSTASITLGNIFAQLATRGLSMINNALRDSEKMYEDQYLAETKLAVIMKQRMNATDSEIQSILQFTSAQQQMGVIGDEVQLGAAQQVSTFLKQKDSLESLIPAMNNLIAQQYGFDASVESGVSIANMFGKVLEGNTGALTRVGISFSEAEEKALKYGDEATKVATLAQVVKNNVGDMNYELANTPLGQMAQLNNEWGDTKELLGKLISDIKKDFVGAGRLLVKTFGDAIKTVREFGTFVKSNLTIIVPILAGIGAVILGLVIPALWAMIPPLIAQAILWLSINWPILLIGAAVAGLIALFLQFPEVFGVVSGVFMVAVAAIWNRLLGLGDFILGLVGYLINPFINFANFLANVFTSPVSSIVYLFQGMADSILGLLENIASMIDKIFGSNLASGVAGWRTGLKSMADEVVKQYAPDENYEQKYKAFNMKMEDLGLSTMDYGAAWESGKEWGTGAATSAKDFLSGISATGTTDPTASGLAGINDKLSDTNTLLDGAGSLKSAGDVTIKDDNLKYLLDIATRGQVQAYQSAPINVQVTTGDIHTEADENRLANSIAKIFTDNMQTSIAY